MVSVMSASCYIASASRYHPRYQSRSSMYIRGLILWNWPRQFRMVVEGHHTDTIGQDKQIYLTVKL